MVFFFNHTYLCMCIYDVILTLLTLFFFFPFKKSYLNPGQIGGRKLSFNKPKIQLVFDYNKKQKYTTKSEMYVEYNDNLYRKRKFQILKFIIYATFIHLINFLSFFSLFLF